MGAGFKATLWRNREGQEARFAAICDAVDFTGTRVLDAGSGVGDLAAWLIEQDRAPAQMLGIDALAPMVEASIARSLPNCTFEVADIVTDLSRYAGWDWVVVSGTCNAMAQELALEVLATAWKGARCGVAFNFLSDAGRREGEDLSPATRFDRRAVLEMALALAPRVDFRQNYLGLHDALVVLRAKDC